MTEHREPGAPDDRHDRILARGLAAFDARVSKQRGRRRVVAAACAACAIGGAAWLFMQALPSRGVPAHHASATPILPAYVSIIKDEAQLNVELALASACERVGRRGSQIYVVECARVHP